jgi:hypothetical protein
MALRDSMRDSAAAFTRPDEQIQAVIGAQTASPMMLPLVGWIITMFINKYRIIAVTSQRILVLDAGKMSVKRARSIVTELPRSTRLGPPSGIWYKIQAGSEKLYVHRRFFKDINVADGMESSVTG